MACYKGEAFKNRLITLYGDYIKSYFKKGNSSESPSHF